MTVILIVIAVYLMLIRWKLADILDEIRDWKEPK